MMARQGTTGNLIHVQSTTLPHAQSSLEIAFSIRRIEESFRSTIVQGSVIKNVNLIPVT
jgi:hypothetical protein